MEQIKKYVKLPVEIQAVHYLPGETSLSKAEMLHILASWGVSLELDLNTNELIIYTLEDGSSNQARHVADPGDYIIKGIRGEFYPCKPDIFNKTYKQVIDSDKESLWRRFLKAFLI